MISSVESHLSPFLVNSLQLYVVVTDLKGKYIYTNKTFETVFGYLSDDFKGEDFSASVWHEDRKLCIETSIQCIRNPDESKLLKIRKPSIEDGKFIWTSWEFSAFKIDNEVKGILCIGYDSTKEFELSNKLLFESNRLKNLIECSNQISILIDLNYQILDFNTLAAKEFEKYLCKNLAIGSSIQDYIPKNHKDEFFLDFQKAKLGNESIRKFKVKCDFGKNIWYKTHLYPIVDHNDDVVQILLRSQDITKQVFSERKIALQKERIDEIVWNHSHVVRSPLSNILGFVNLMLENKNSLSPEEIDYIIESIGHETKKLDTIIKEKVKKARKN